MHSACGDSECGQECWTGMLPVPSVIHGPPMQHSMAAGHVTATGAPGRGGQVGAAAHARCTDGANTTRVAVPPAPSGDASIISGCLSMIRGCWYTNSWASSGPLYASAAARCALWRAHLVRQPPRRRRPSHQAEPGEPWSELVTTYTPQGQVAESTAADRTAPRVGPSTAQDSAQMRQYSCTLVFPKR